MTSVFVDDPNRAIQFYTEVLGFVTKMHVPEAKLAIVTSPDDPMGTGPLLEPNGNLNAADFQRRVNEVGLPTIVFGVADIQQEYARLHERGVVFRRNRRSPTTALRHSLKIPAATSFNSYRSKPITAVVSLITSYQCSRGQHSTPCGLTYYWSHQLSALDAPVIAPYNAAAAPDWPVRRF